VKGKAVTPFLLARIKDLTGGRSLATNIALVKNNAHLGAEVAAAFAAG
jgi:pseudouridine-5'-phosphate glycosidase